MSFRFIASYIFFIVIISASFWFAGNLISPQDQVGASLIKFSIQSGQSVFDIAFNLSQLNIIKSRPVFILYSFLSGHFSDFQPGNYALKPTLNVRELIAVLTTGPQDVTVTIIPGMSLKEIDQLLSRSGVIEDGELENFNPAQIKDPFSFLEGVKNLEGFLMPDTYRFRPESNIKEAVTIILTHFKKEVDQSGVGYEGFYRKLIIASLLEKEVITDADKKLVAGIIEKRLSLGMPLQIDATVIYAKCQAYFDCQISKKDYSADSLFNTYKYKGLPPAPISNPLISSITAASNPVKSKYPYYLSDRKTDKTIFSSTLEEHEANRAKYLEL